MRASLPLVFQPPSFTTISRAMEQLQSAIRLILSLISPSTPNKPRRNQRPSSLSLTHTQPISSMIRCHNITNTMVLVQAKLAELAEAKQAKCPTWSIAFPFASSGSNTMCSLRFLPRPPSAVPRNQRYGLAATRHVCRSASSSAPHTSIV